MYKFIFYPYYLFAKLCKEKMYLTMFQDPPFDAVMILSLMEFLNIVTLGIVLRVPCITTNHNLDMTLLAIIIFGFNYFYFLYKRRYLKLISDCDSTEIAKSFFLGIVALVYTTCSFFFFYLASSPLIPSQP